MTMPLRFPLLFACLAVGAFAVDTPAFGCFCRVSTTGTAGQASSGTPAFMPSVSATAPRSSSGRRGNRRRLGAARRRWAGAGRNAACAASVVGIDAGRSFCRGVSLEGFLFASLTQPADVGRSGHPVVTGRFGRMRADEALCGPIRAFGGFMGLLGKRRRFGLLY